MRKKDTEKHRKKERNGETKIAKDKEEEKIYRNRIGKEKFTYS